MKILTIGGNFSIVNGYTNAVVSIAETLGKKEEVYLMQLFPVISRGSNRVHNNVTVIRKTLTLKIAQKMIGKYSESCESIKTYAYPFSLTGIFYLLNDMINRSVLEEVIERLKPDVVHLHGVILDTLPFIEVLLDKKAPFCVTLHALAPNDPNTEQKYSRDFDADVLGKLIENKVFISTVSSQLKNYISEEMHLSDRNVEFIPNGVDITRFAACSFHDREDIRAKHKIPLNKKVFLQVGTLNKRKNQIAMLEALAEMPEHLRNEIHYVAIGDGPERDYLLLFAREHKIENNCTFTGRISDEERDALYCASDFFILLSTSEGMALVMLEAMAAGLPVITFGSLEGINNIYHDKCFQLIPERTTEDIINTIEAALGQDWDREKIVSHVQKWTWEAACEQYRALYEKVLRNQ